MSRNVLLAGLVLVGTTAIANAGVVETAASRTMLVDVDTSVGPTDNFTDSTTAMGNWLSDPVVGIFSSGYGGTAFGYHNTDINPGAYSGVLSMGASADGGDGFGLPSAYAESTLTIDFTLDTTMDFTISGFVDAFGDGSSDACLAEVAIANVGVGGSPTQLIASVDEAGSYTPFAVSGVLLAGDYQLQVESLAISQRLFESGYSSPFADVNFSMTVTPEPSSLALIGLGAVAMLRRKR